MRGDEKMTETIKYIGIKLLDDKIHYEEAKKEYLEWKGRYDLFTCNFWDIHKLFRKVGK